MAIQDLRDWIALMESAGELRKVHGADSDVELGVIVDQYQRRITGLGHHIDQHTQSIVYRLSMAIALVIVILLAGVAIRLLTH